MSHCLEVIIRENIPSCKSTDTHTTPYIDFQLLIIQVFNIVTQIFVQQMDDELFENHTVSIFNERQIIDIN